MGSERVDEIVHDVHDVRWNVMETDGVITAAIRTLKHTEPVTAGNLMLGVAF